MNCRFCNNPLTNVFVDLINSPASNSFLHERQLNEPENYYPLKVYTCEKCFLVQLDEFKKSNDIFNDEYVYFSSFSTSWLEHSENYVNTMSERFQFNQDSLVIEIASNDGYLLQYFKQKNIPVLGIEPTANTAAAAIEKGIETKIDFFGTVLATELVSHDIKADLLLGNNVLAHVPDINDFVAGMKIILKNTGIITMEFPHVMQMINNNQFDTIYHEHFSYLSCITVQKIFELQGLALFDVEELPTHGGSLRIYAKHKENNALVVSDRLLKLLQKEQDAGLNNIHFYSHFKEKVSKIKFDFLIFLLEQKRIGKKVAAYGAAAKGNTLLNYCGLKNDLIEFVVDANPAKQNKFLPGSHIPVVNETHLKETKPDYVIIFPWNIKDEVEKQLDYIKAWGGKFVIPIPGLQVL